MTRPAHSPRWCRPVPGTYLTHGRSSHDIVTQSQVFACPCCGRESRRLLNFLGGMRATDFGVAHPLMCVGTAFVFPSKQTAAQCGAAMVAHVSSCGDH